MPPKTVFVETTPFGSRLHVLGPLVEAAARVGPVTLLMPAREIDTHFERWLEQLPPDVSVRVLSSQDSQLWRRLVALLGLATRMSRRSDRIVLAALDDYMSCAPWVAVWLALMRVRGLRVLVGKYRVQQVFTWSLSPRALAVRLVVRGLCRVGKACLFVFDERVEEQRRVVVLPDPWEGPFVPGRRTEAHERLGLIPGSRQVLGLIGKQDERKGFDISVASIERLVANRKWDGIVLLLGSVEESMRLDLARLRQLLGDRLVHVSRFVSDEELPDYFAACDVILMPYSASFTATSGVLARAAATGVPVVTASHGLVADRVTRNRLGLAVAREPSALAEAVIAIRDRDQVFDAAALHSWALTSEKTRFVRTARRELFSA